VQDLLIDGSRRSFITTSFYLYAMNVVSNGTLKYKVLPEKIRSYHYGFKFSPNHFMFEVIKRKVEQLLESGITQFLVKKGMNKMTLETQKKLFWAFNISVFGSKSY
jgi:hypothetical protein